MNLVILKTKEGVIDKVHGKNTVIIKDMFQKQTNVSLFFGRSVYIDHSDYSMIGTITCGFGNSGKVKAQFKENLEPLKDQLKNLPVHIKIEKIVKM